MIWDKQLEKNQIFFDIFKIFLKIVLFLKIKKDFENIEKRSGFFRAECPEIRVDLSENRELSGSGKVVTTGVTGFCAEKK